MLNRLKWFILTSVTFATGYYSMLQAMPRIDDRLDPLWLIPVVLYLGSVALIWICCELFRYKGDWSILWGTFLLTGIGVTMQTRMSTTLADWHDLSQWHPLLIGMGGFLVAVLLFKHNRSQKLLRFGFPAYLLSLGVLGTMLLLGQRYRGGLYLAGHLNPVEVIKPLLALFLASYLSKPLTKPRILLLGGLWALLNLVLVICHDFGLILLLNLLFITTFAITTKQPLYLILSFLLLALIATSLPKLIPHIAARFAVWQDPFADPLGKGWQPLQALCALYSGGLFGAGIGGGAVQYVPIVTSDFIYAALAEEIGLIGTLAILLLYWLIARQAIRNEYPTPFRTLFATNLALLLLIQTYLNIGGVVKAIPMTGITLPLISHGGSSLVVTLFSMGLLLALSDKDSK